MTCPYTTCPHHHAQHTCQVGDLATEIEHLDAMIAQVAMNLDAMGFTGRESRVRWIGGMLDAGRL